MGFFSSIKKFLGAAPADTAKTEAVSAETSTSIVQKQERTAARPLATTHMLADETTGAWQKELTLALRTAEPRLSTWLAEVLAGVDNSGDMLWQRLHFFFNALEAPEQEADDFIASFKKWLELMEYSNVSDFRSELQYRLALALELEDEEDERSRLIHKLSSGLSKAREQIVQGLDNIVASHSQLNDAFWDEILELLVLADLGFEPAQELVRRLRRRAAKNGCVNPADIHTLLQDELTELFAPKKRITAINPPEIILMLGVNGVGKTTTIAKLAHRAVLQGKKVLIAAGDTFRAAAIEQLQVWAERTGADFYAKSAGADPAAVAFEAVDKAISEGYDILFIDTAGRLQTKTNLMEELEKIRRVIGKKHPGAPHRSILVVDATTGQNALSQARLFNETSPLSEIILTKLDGTAKGGIVAAIAMQLKLPISYVGLGEKMEDLRPFNGADFARALLGTTKEAEKSTE